MRVLSVSTLFPRPEQPGFGGFVARQFEALAARADIDLTVISPIAKPLYAGPPSRDTSRGYPVHYLPFATIPKLGARYNPALIARAALPLIRKLHAEQPFDLIDAQFFYPDGPAAARIAAALGLPLSIKARGSDILYWGGQGYALKAMLAAAAQADAMLAVSAALKSDMVGLGMSADKITVHYTGLDHALFKPRPRAEARAAVADIVPIDGRLLVAVGNLIPLKGQQLLIPLPNFLPKDDLRILIAGTGPEEGNLRALAAQLGLSKRITFAGSLQPERLAVLLAAADAMVLPSASEGLANAWIEALACGTPLVITDVGGAREVVTSPSAGRLVDRTPTAIAAAVRELLANPPAQDEVAAHAERYSWEANAAQLSAHYQQIVGA